MRSIVVWVQMLAETEEYCVEVNETIMNEAQNTALLHNSRLSNPRRVWLANSSDVVCWPDTLFYFFFLTSLDPEAHEAHNNNVGLKLSSKPVQYLRTHLTKIPTHPCWPKKRYSPFDMDIGFFFGQDMDIGLSSMYEQLNADLWLYQKINWMLIWDALLFIYLFFVNFFWQILC